MTLRCQTCDGELGAPCELENATVRFCTACEDYALTVDYRKYTAAQVKYLRALVACMRSAKKRGIKVHATLVRCRQDVNRILVTQDDTLVTCKSCLRAIAQGKAALANLLKKTEGR